MQPKSLFLSEPLLGIRSAVWASRPTAWTTFSTTNIFAESNEMFFSRLSFLYDSHPTNPLVAR